MTRTRPAVVEKQKEKKRKERKKKTRGGGRKKRGREERRRRTEERKREETGHNQFCVCVMRAGGLQKGAVSKDKFFHFFLLLLLLPQLIFKMFVLTRDYGANRPKSRHDSVHVLKMAVLRGIGKGGFG